MYLSPASSPVSLHTRAGDPSVLSVAGWVASEIRADAMSDAYLRAHAAEIRAQMVSTGPNGTGEWCAYTISNAFDVMTCLGKRAIHRLDATTASCAAPSRSGIMVGDGPRCGVLDDSCSGAAGTD